ncbi:MAG: class I SAM-dependent methyltransferase [Desulfobulbus sp.]|nr:class I SAM-dependent methyltransferase [Desulfobulbus sp.]
MPDDEPIGKNITTDSFNTDGHTTQGFLNINQRAVLSYNLQLFREMINHSSASHYEVYGALRDVLLSRGGDTFSLVDFGCGDALYMSRILPGTGIGSYTGIDLSETALHFARKNMADVGCSQQFIAGNFITTAEHNGLKADVIWLGFALHHLPADQREFFLACCRQMLPPKGGCLMVFDPVLRDSEDSDGFLDRWRNACFATALSTLTAKTGSVRHHVLREDFPFSPSELWEMARRVGFCSWRRVASEGTEIYELVCLE